MGLISFTILSLLLETRDASFKPVPLVQKPISSVLEKIRKRKLEIAKKWVVYFGFIFMYILVNVFMLVLCVADLLL